MSLAPVILKFQFVYLICRTAFLLALLLACGASSAVCVALPICGLSLSGVVVIRAHQHPFIVSDISTPVGAHQFARDALAGRAFALAFQDRVDPNVLPLPLPITDVAPAAGTRLLEASQRLERC